MKYSKMEERVHICIRISLYGVEDGFHKLELLIFFFHLMQRVLEGCYIGDKMGHCLV